MGSQKSRKNQENSFEKRLRIYDGFGHWFLMILEPILRLKMPLEKVSPRTFRPRAPQEWPRAFQESPRSSQERPRWPQERSKSAQDGFKGALRASHDGVKSVFRTLILFKCKAKNQRKTTKNPVNNVSGFMMVLDIDFQWFSMPFYVSRWPSKDEHLAFQILWL